MQQLFKEIKLFKGLKNDEDSKDIPVDYFFKLKNYNYSNIGTSGFNKILMPKQVNQLVADKAVDGVYQYRFLDSNNVLQIEDIGVCDGNIYKNILTTPVLLKSGLTAGKCSFTILNDKLYIANGKDYVYVYDGLNSAVSQMGAPIAVASTTVGVLNGPYYYAMTYTTAGGEEILGSVSNTVTVLNRKIELKLPLGYAGVTSRKIYRTEDGGTTLKLLATISDNTTLTYTDNILDASLTTQIGTINNELPKPYFLATFGEKIIGAKVDLYPTQIFITDTEIDVFDVANSVDIANYADDNSPVNGIGVDFDRVMIGTLKHIYLINIGTTTSVIVTRANVGVKDGYSIQRLPALGMFAGGLFFVSTLNDIRLLNGLDALDVTNSINNIRTENFAQNIRGDLDKYLKSPSNIDSEFYAYKYHLVINNKKWVFDIRTQGWTFHDIRTTTYTSMPHILVKLGDYLYNGQTDGWVEKEYQNIQYRGEDVEALLESPHIFVDNKYKYVEKLLFWFIPTADNKLNIQVITDDNLNLETNYDFNLLSGGFEARGFESYGFEIAAENDYRIFNIQKPCRWFKFILKNTIGNIDFQGWSVFVQTMTNKE